MLPIEIIPFFLFLLILAVIYLKELRLVSRFVKDRWSHKKQTAYFLTRSALILHFLAIAGILCFMYGYFIEPYQLKVTHIEILSGKLKRDNFRIVQISDLHCDKKIRNEYKLIELVNKLNPDIIVFTGDSINSPQAINIFKTTIRALKAKLGKVAVNGNFDAHIWQDLDIFGNTDFEVFYKASSMFSKDNDSVCIYGLDINAAIQSKDLLKKTSPGCFNIFLFHTPDLIEEVSESNIDLYLAGHTHGGQVALPFYGAVITFSKYGKKYESGFYNVGNTILYVNRGIGMEGVIPIPRVRFLSSPEITVFDIKPKN